MGEGKRWFEQGTGGSEPKIRDESVMRTDSGPNLWHRCEGCGETLFKATLAENHQVCPHCGRHFLLGALERLDLLLDTDSFEPCDGDLVPCDPLGFVDRKPYHQRLEQAREKLGRNDAFIAGAGMIDGIPIEVGSFDFRFMAGSMGSVVGECVTRLFERATERKVPALVISASGGARMQEGVLSLMQMARTSAALGRLRDEAGMPYISLLTHPTTGGVAASFAMLGDVNLAEPDALIGFAGPRVIEQTIGEALPEGFQTSEYLLEHGMVDRIVPRSELKETLARMLRLLLDPA